MESHGEPGKIQVSETTRGLLEGKCAFVDRGEVEVKGKGAMRTSFPLGPARACPGGNANSPVGSQLADRIDFPRPGRGN